MKYEVTFTKHYTIQIEADSKKAAEIIGCNMEDDEIMQNAISESFMEYEYVVEKVDE